MAKRSDFAQKLLDDLRLRKERMDTPQSSNKSTRIASDGYATSKQIHRGSRDMKTQGTIASRSRNTHTGQSGSNRSPYIEESSNHIVPYSRGQSSHQIGDLSMALAFALENGGNIRSTDFSRNNYMLNFLHQIGRGSIGKMEKRSRAERFQPNYPTLSYIHIKEISKGAEKLNQILRVCSNGIKFNKYSIEIGKELLKGAMDLEESLRMLVNLQEGSEYMIRSQSNTRITLLEDDEDEDDKKAMHEQKQLTLPRFSFDNIPRNSHEKGVKRSGLKQKLPTLNYIQEATNLLDRNQALIPQKMNSNKKSASYGTVASCSEQKNNSSSIHEKQGKGRMSNVIAKLMGIDDILEESHSKSTTQNGLSSKEKVAGMNSSQVPGAGSTEKFESKTMETVIPTFSQSQKLMKDDNKPVIKNSKVVNMPAYRTRLEEGNLKGKLPRKNVNGIKSMAIIAKEEIAIDSQKSSIDQLQLVYQERERKQKDVRQLEQKETEKGKSRVPLLKFGLQQKELQTKLSKSALTFQEGYKENIFQFDKRYVSKCASENQKKSLNSIELQQPQVLKKTEIRAVKHNEKEGEQQHGKQDLQDRKQKGTEIASKSLSKPTHDPSSLRKKQLDTNYLGQRKQNYSLKGQEAEFRKVNTPVQQGMEQKQSCVQATKKAHTTRIQEKESPRKIDEGSARTNGNLHNLARPLKQNNPITREAKPVIQEKLNEQSGADQAKVSGFKEVEANIVESNSLATRIKQVNGPEELHREVKQGSTLHSSDSNEFQNLQKAQVLSSNDINQKTNTAVTSNPQELILGRDEQLSHINVTSDAPTAVTGEDQMFISCPQQSDYISIFTKSRKQEALREGENRLKQILISSQVFLNIAEALFKLNIPMGILKIGTYELEDEESTVTLECSLEIMKRKGKRQELDSHPSTSISMRLKRIRSLDGLVKQLHNEFETLKFYGRKGKKECPLEDYLQQMLENDLNDINPDLNCMWDLGWNERMFSFLEKHDVIRGIEKHILKGLVDEVTREFLHI